MLQSKVILSWFVQIICYQTIEGNFGRDLSIWTKSRGLVDLEISTHRAIGINPLAIIKSFDIFSYGLSMEKNPLYGFTTISSDLHVLNGRGVSMRKDKEGKIVFEINTPLRKVNSCGFLISSNFVSNMTIFWKSSAKNNYEIISRPDNGRLVFDMTAKVGQAYGAVFFDSIPAIRFKFIVYPKSNKPLILKMASINKCILSGKQIAVACGESMEKNNKFINQPYGVPISIKCPTDCIRTWPCWGYKIYSSDSPICWTATQNFGRWGNGFYTIYKIKKVYYFRDEKHLNNGIYCRRSVTAYSGYTFDKKYYDFAENESKNLS